MKCFFLVNVVRVLKNIPTVSGAAIHPGHVTSLPMEDQQHLLTPGGNFTSPINVKCLSLDCQWGNGEAVENACKHGPRRIRIIKNDDHMDCL